MTPEDILISFYKEKKSKGQIFSEQIESLGCYNKLGESIMISSIPEKTFKENKNITLNIDNNYYLNLVLKNNSASLALALITTGILFLRSRVTVLIANPADGK